MRPRGTMFLRSRSKVPIAASSSNDVDIKGVKRPRKTRGEEEGDEKESKVARKKGTFVMKEKFEDSVEIKEASTRWEPIKWREQLENIKLMRASRDAPVDTIGAAALPKSSLPHVKRFQVLVSLMLSSQTKDEVTAKAMSQLQEHGLNIESIIKMSDDKLAGLIFPVGFYRRKVQYLKKTAQILEEKYNGDIPDSLDGLMALPGVGPKMAHLCMDIAWGNVTGIGVDTHVHRVANRLKWVKRPTLDPEKTRKALEDWLPQSEWSAINWLLVGFGQQTCLPVRPNCSDCLNRSICPSSTAKK